MHNVVNYVDWVYWLFIMSTKECFFNISLWLLNSYQRWALEYWIIRSLEKDMYHIKYENNNSLAYNTAVIQRCREIYTFRHGKISVGWKFSMKMSNAYLQKMRKWLKKLCLKFSVTEKSIKFNWFHNFITAKNMQWYFYPYFMMNKLDTCKLYVILQKSWEIRK